jgi:hypothetical protein
MAEGQVCRIVVVGGGSITLPATLWKYPKGGPQYGAAFTIIGVTFVGGYYFTTFTPYDV